MKKYASRIYLCLVFAILYIPILTLMLFSFNNTDGNKYQYHHNERDCTTNVISAGNKLSFDSVTYKLKGSATKLL